MGGWVQAASNVPDDGRGGGRGEEAVLGDEHALHAVGHRHLGNHLFWFSGRVRCHGWVDAGWIRALVPSSSRTQTTHVIHLHAHNTTPIAQCNAMVSCSTPSPRRTTQRILHVHPHMMYVVIVLSVGRSTHHHFNHSPLFTYLDGFRVEVAPVPANHERTGRHVRAEVLEGVEHRLCVNGIEI